MDTWDAIRARRNVRSYREEPIPEEHLHRILEAGRRAPSANNRQPWDFILSTDHQQLQSLAAVWRGAGHIGRSAATVTLVLETPEDDRRRVLDQYDLGQATMAMMLAAADLGIGSGHAAIEDQEACRRLLHVPPTHYCAYLLALGYPDDRPLRPIAQPQRRAFESVVHRGGW